MTLLPRCSLLVPSTTTNSPGFNPRLIADVSPCVAPTSTLPEEDAVSDVWDGSGTDPESDASMTPSWRLMGVDVEREDDVDDAIDGVGEGVQVFIPMGYSKNRGKCRV